MASNVLSFKIKLFKIKISKIPKNYILYKGFRDALVVETEIKNQSQQISDFNKNIWIITLC